ncbi:MAG: DUF928 domain-containing protein [Deltaproteobacteria bacterium]|nr:DUF928 domain-containing protein [Deltaproteobacteria bacterium]
MKTTLISPGLILVGIILFFPLPSGAEDHPLPPVNEVAANHASATPDCQQTLQPEETVPPAEMPVYRPPLRGAPVGRVAGGTRGKRGAAPFLCTLVPNHVGLTVSGQPALYFFLADAASYPLEFTLIERHGISPLVEVRFAPPLEAGIHTLCLENYGKKLAVGVRYKWFVALIPNEEHRAGDILAAGEIERVAFQDELKHRLDHVDAAAAATIYAENGIWYDALASLSRAIGSHPANRKLVRERAFLLEQVGLDKAARYEKQRLD